MQLYYKRHPSSDLFFQFIHEELADLAQQVLACVSAINAMIPIGIDIHLEVFVGLHQCLRIFKGVLRMQIVVGVRMKRSV